MNHQTKAKIAELAKQYGRQVFHSAYRLLADEHLAEDVTQEVFLKLFKKPTDAFNSITHWPGYLKSMAISAAIDQLRRTKRLSETSLPEPDQEQLENTHSEPLKALLTERDLDQFRLGLRALHPQDAEVFCLRHIEGCSYQEIAELLNISTNLVGVTLHRAQQKLSKHLDESQLLGESNAITI